MAPSVTEILFEIEASDRIVAVTRYCDYPEEAKQIPNIGGFIDPNYEMIVRSKPDLVVTLLEHGDARHRLEKLGIETLTVDHRTVKTIIESITDIGKAIGSEKSAENLREKLSSKIETIRSNSSSKKKVKTLIVVGGHSGSSVFDRVYVAGNKTFYNELLEIAGGENVAASLVGDFPTLSAESIIKLNPDVIIDLVPDAKSDNLENVMKSWGSIPNLRAFKSGNVHVFFDEYMVNPGPRIDKILETFSKQLNKHHG